MNRWHDRQVLECGSPLPLWRSWIIESVRGLAQSKTLTRHWGRFMASMRGNVPSFFLGSIQGQLNLARVALMASKFGNSFGDGVCSLYCTTPFLSMTKAARALVAPKPSRSSSNTP
jgi:hypothetical protein